MRFYTKRHQFYCGVDLHARSMYLCVLDDVGNARLHKNFPARPGPFLKAIAPFREDVVVCAECMFSWYWLADLCSEQDIPFVLGHALYMRAIHGGKAKNDRVDAYKIAALLKGGNLPTGYVYPQKMRSTRDLMRRRMFFSRKRADLLAHIQNTCSQYNHEPFSKDISYRSNRSEIADHFPDPSVRKSIELDLSLLDFYEDLLRDLELTLVRTAKSHDTQTLHRLRTIPGVGKILSLVMLYEIHDVTRFPRVQDFLSYSRLVKCAKESAGKRLGTSGGKIGNAHLKWAFSEAAVLFLRKNTEGHKYFKRLEKRHGKGKALSVLAQKLGRAVYFMLNRKRAFELTKFVR